MNRKFLLGCAGVFVVAAAVLVVGLLVAGPRLFEKGKGWFQTQVKEFEQTAAFENGWQPPAAEVDERWFPRGIGAWTTSGADLAAGVPELGIDRAGRSATYRSEGQSFEVFVCAANDLERDALFTRAKSALEKGGGSRTTTQFGPRLDITRNGTEETRLWWLKGWLFVFRTSGPKELKQIAPEYLEAIRGAEPTRAE